ncbi:hypothetical protein RHMOL_Rhmol07G0185100 [Rhododendron molle]|uniref:Uncharacterized protein n=1 Tax=Rhododendron molle TaxID=49168 RepID=A0ACC0N230_RHOML|nr:hypothetical protein RHMOL_Rhmol07G0185100 [Rhododendron molle]
MKPGLLEGLSRQLVPGSLYLDAPQSIDVLMCGFHNSCNPSTLMAALFFLLMADFILGVSPAFVKISPLAINWCITVLEHHQNFQVLIYL